MEFDSIRDTVCSCIVGCSEEKLDADQIAVWMQVSLISVPRWSRPSSSANGFASATRLTITDFRSTT